MNKLRKETEVPPSLRDVLPQSLGSTSPLKGTNIELIHEGENQALYIYRNQNLKKEPESKQTMPL